MPAQFYLGLPAPSPTGERRGPVDRRLGERRLETIPVPFERRADRERRRPTDRRESPAGHLRNAIQILAALADRQPEADKTSAELIQAAIARLHQALDEVDRLAKDRLHVGLLLRLRQRGLAPDALPGLRDWLM
jgi:alkylhydroperoxidase family enzyme